MWNPPRQSEANESGQWVSPDVGIDRPALSIGRTTGSAQPSGNAAAAAAAGRPISLLARVTTTAGRSDFDAGEGEHRRDLNVPTDNTVVNDNINGYDDAMLQTADRRPYHHGNIRSAFLDAAERSLRDHGAAQISLRDLAREVGVSHAAPRRHFTDRQGLLDALAESGFVRLGNQLRSALANTDADFAVRVGNAVVAFMAFATENSSLYELMNASKHRSGEQRIVEAADAAFQPMVELIAEGQDRGLLEAGDPEQIGIVFFATIQGIATMTNGGLIQKELLGDLTATAVRQFLQGARPVEM
jgi:AcrR family transcriptional regulator